MLVAILRIHPPLSLQAKRRQPGLFHVSFSQVSENCSDEGIISADEINPDLSCSAAKILGVSG